MSENSLAAYLGVRGLTGLIAYFGLLDVGRLSDGGSVLVSGADGGRRHGPSNHRTKDPQ